jgi:hypothetical protein
MLLLTNVCKAHLFFNVALNGIFYFDTNASTFILSKSTFSSMVDTGQIFYFVMVLNNPLQEGILMVSQPFALYLGSSS